MVYFSFFFSYKHHFINFCFIYLIFSLKQLSLSNNHDDVVEPFGIVSGSCTNRLHTKPELGFLSHSTTSTMLPAFVF